MTAPSDPTDTPPAHPAAQVIDYTPVRRRAEPNRHTDAPSPYETLAYLAYVLPARIYAANPWLLDPKYRNHLENR